jgi:cytochrome b
MAITLTANDIAALKRYRQSPHTVRGALENTSMVSAAYANDDAEEHEEELMEEIHEFITNMMLHFVAMHLSYMILFKRSLAKFMLLMPSTKQKKVNRLHMQPF